MSPLLPIFLFVLVDVLGFSLVLPLLPFLTAEFAMTPLMVGAVQSANAVAQLLAVPVIGVLADRHGRRPLLLLCVAGTFVSFALLAAARSPAMILLSRVLDGALGGNISLANACIADLTTPETRGKGMGLVGAAFGLGFIVGPAVGGILAQQYGWWVPPAVAAALSLLNLLCVYRMAETLPLPHRHATPLTTAVGADLKGVWRCLGDPVVGPLLGVRFGHCLVFTVFEQNYGFFTREVLSQTARSSAFGLSFFALLFAAAQGVGLKALTRRLGPSPLLRAAFLAAAAAFALAAMASSPSSLAAVICILGPATGICNAVTTAEVSTHVGADVQGRTLGVSASLGSLSRIVGPLAAGPLLQGGGARVPFLLCAALCTLLALAARSRTPVKD
jgi:DHA1 family tetracycline resistance protein-like MFS transporter